MRISALLLFVALTSCQISRPLEEQHPSIQRAPGSVDDSEEAKREALARTAAADLGCAHADVVLTFPLRYANSAGLRYVVEGCGVRAMYAESCEAYPSCRYLLVSTVPMITAPKAPSDAPPPSKAPSP